MSIDISEVLKSKHSFHAHCNGAQVQAAAQDIWMLSLGSDLPPGKVARIPLLLFAPPLSLDLDQARDEDDCANMSQTILSYLAHLYVTFLCSLDVAIDMIIKTANYPIMICVTNRPAQ